VAVSFLPLEGPLKGGPSAFWGDAGPKTTEEPTTKNGVVVSTWSKPTRPSYSFKSWLCGPCDWGAGWSLRYWKTPCIQWHDQAKFICRARHAVPLL